MNAPGGGRRTVSLPHEIASEGGKVPAIFAERKDKKLSSIINALRPSILLCAKTMLKRNGMSMMLHTVKEDETHWKDH